MLRATYQAYDVDGKALGRLTYATRADRPVWSMCVNCYLHGCKVMIAEKQNPSEAGAIDWLAAGRGNASMTAQEHKQLFPAYALPG